MTLRNNRRFHYIGEHLIVSTIERSPIEQKIAVTPSLPLKEVENYVTIQFGLLYDLCHRHDIPIPAPPISASQASEEFEKPELLSAYAQQRAERNVRRLERDKKKRGDRIKAGWITRRGVQRIMAKNPGTKKSDALEIYLAERPRTRAEIPTSETAKTPSQKAWVSRLQNIIDETDQIITWAEAHQIALSRFRGVNRKTGT